MKNHRNIILTLLSVCLLVGGCGVDSGLDDSDGALDRDVDEITRLASGDQPSAAAGEAAKALKAEVRAACQDAVQALRARQQAQGGQGSKPPQRRKMGPIMRLANAFRQGILNPQ